MAKVKTWVYESAVVLILLVIPMIFTGISWRELVGTLAVFFTFKQTQIADRMTEKQSAQVKPDVHCYKWFYRHFYFKEILWVIFFIMVESWSALIGCGVFLIYPIWRKTYRRYKPLLAQ